ncbi:hypothetical protein, partial [Trichlorobacter lovleyi]|uniref:hypothetical protein n=1 Tax=Trichlorobacter lovleyi TaxID=313985 RepID=UPI003D10294E
MDRRTFLTTMLQGSLASVALPNRLASLLAPPHATFHQAPTNYQQNLHISAIGIGTFGSSCTHLLTNSARKLHCYQLDFTQQHYGAADILRVVTAYPQTDLLFVFADTRQKRSANILKASLESASASGIQTVVIGPSQSTHWLLHTLAESNALYCTESDPIAASSLVTTLYDFANYGNLDGVVAADVNGYVKAILQKGNWSVFASSYATGPTRGSLASQSVLALLEQQVSDSDIYSGAIACIYCCQSALKIDPPSASKIDPP